MKKFFVMILLVSTFFIGLGSLIERAGATLKSDTRALELIRQSRIAIGGDANINNVRSLTIAGTSTHFFDREGLNQTEQGTLEINLQLPNQFSKLVRIGNPDENGGNLQQKRIEVIVVKDGDGNILTENVRGVENSNNLKIDGDKKIIVRTADGTTENIKSGDKNTIIVQKKDGDTRTFKTEDGKKIIVNSDVKTENISGNRHNEMFRTTLALLLTAPEGLDVSYTFAGEGSVDGNSCNIVEAQTGGSTFKLFLDKSTFLPRMISFMGMEMPNIIKRDKPVGDAPQKDVKIMVRTSEDFATVEYQVKFSDYRTVNGLLLPFTWTETVGGKQSQNVSITNYEINPANIADKFKGQKVFVRKHKDQ